MLAKRKKKTKRSPGPASLPALAKPTDVLLLALVSASLGDPSPHTDFVFNVL